MKTATHARAEYPQEIPALEELRAMTVEQRMKVFDFMPRIIAARLCGPDKALRDDLYCAGRYKLWQLCEVFDLTEIRTRSHIRGRFYKNVRNSIVDAMRRLIGRVKDGRQCARGVPTVSIDALDGDCGIAAYIASEEETITAAADRSSDIEEMRHSLGVLPEHIRTVIQKRYFEEMELASIGEQMGYSAQNVWQVLRKGINQMRVTMRA